MLGITRLKYIYKMVFFWTIWFNLFKPFWGGPIADMNVSDSLRWLSVITKNRNLLTAKIGKFLAGYVEIGIELIQQMFWFSWECGLPYEFLPSYNVA